MAFDKEPIGYGKTILSDLQGAWSGLLKAVVDSNPFDRQHDLIFHIHEATSWKNVRNLAGMQKILLLIKNIIYQFSEDDEVKFWINEVDVIFNEVKDKISKGELL